MDDINEWSFVTTDGAIYCWNFSDEVPASLIKVKPWSNSISVILKDIDILEESYYGAVVGHDGCIYYIPCDEKRVMKFDPKTKSIAFIGESYTSDDGLWSGGVLGPDGCIYGIPHNASQILKIDVINQSTSLVGPIIEGDDKFFGGVLGKDGCIYAAPWNVDYILKFDPRNNTVQHLQDNHNELDRKTWFLPAVAQDGNIYCHNNDSSILCINVPSPTHTLFTPYYRRFLYNNYSKHSKDNDNMMTIDYIREYFNCLDNGTATEFDKQGQTLIPYLLDYLPLVCKTERVEIMFTLISSFPHICTSFHALRMKKRRLD
eukprot:CAMPEP_0184872244 /NCGR_PEP_ID=MMETSP0580-20130426/41172_1 /TAXON_ID=1118495 /ORGANISM="Dactyliosolen fragilissimus" /LENGTH=316 /DNA_ID=CAMNT_0027375003 /DNA_START=435 /DNA_END=1385 /DNA_ORIENTATION=+